MNAFPTPLARWLARATVLSVIGIFTWRSGHLVAGIPAAIVALGSGFLRRGLPVNRTGQLLLLLLAMALTWPAFVGLKDIAGEGIFGMGNAGTVITLFCLLVLLPRQLMAAPLYGPRGDAAVGLLAVMGCAHTRAPTGWGYLLLLVPWVVLQLLTLRAFDDTRPAARALSSRHRLVLALMAVLIGVAAAAGTLTIPPAHRWAMRKAYHTFMNIQTGFSTEMQLGSVSRMYQSNKLVLRVHGPKPDHLRGFVYRHYQGGGQWTAGPRTRLLGAKLEPAAEDQRDLTRVDTVGGDPKRYFVPLGVRDLRAPETLARVNAVGIIRTAPGEEAEQIQFRMGRRDRFRVAPPSGADLAIPAPLAPALRAMARRWTGSTRRPSRQLAAIQARLRTDFKYSLSFERPPGKDPVMDFLTRNRQGHCEYFASAMALLARAAGVPARVISGYLVHERNGLGGYHVVRERNAHSWVEAWVGNRWQTFDPTPASALAEASSQMGTAAAVWDLLATRAGEVLRWITSLTAAHVAGAVSVLFVIWVLLRLWRRRRSRAGATRGDALAYDHAAPPGLVQLLDALSGEGASPRHGNEPLEAYARRLARERRHGEAVEQASSLLSRYAAWRYGGLGRVADLDRAMAALAARLQGPKIQ